MANKNNIKKQHSSDRKAGIAKAGKRAGSAKLVEEQVHEGKFHWIIEQVWTKETMSIDDACAKVKANKATENMVRQIIRTNLANLQEARKVEHQIKLDRATAIAKARMANWS